MAQYIKVCKKILYMGKEKTRKLKKEGLAGGTRIKKDVVKLDLDLNQ